MNHVDLEPLDEWDDDARAALDTLRQVEDLAPNTQQAILASVARKAMWLPQAGEVPRPQAEAPRGSANLAAASGKLGVAILAGALGLVGGVALERGRSKPVAPSTVNLAVAPTPAALPEPVVSPSAIAVENLPVASKPTAMGPTQESVSGKGLSAERGLLDVARTALARGEASEALRAAEQHRASYPSGILAEEREALAIKALVALGRMNEARSRAGAFERKFPSGIMVRTVRSAVEAVDAGLPLPNPP